MTVVRGPKDKAAFRDHPTDWHGYIDPLPECPLGTPFDEPVPSVSEIKKAWPKFLDDWKLGLAFDAAWGARDELATMDEAKAKALIVGAHEQHRDDASKRGKEIHTYLEHRLDGEPTDIDEWSPVHEYVDCLELFLSEVKPKVLASEVIVVGKHWTPFGNELVTAAAWMGTFDAVLDIGGRNVLVDYKSRKRGKAATRYPEEGCQLGGYYSASYWIVEDDQGLRRMEPLPIDALAIVSLAPDAYRLYDVDKGDATEHWLVTVGFHRTMQTARTMFGKPKGSNVETKADANCVLKTWLDGSLELKPARIAPVTKAPERPVIDEGPTLDKPTYVAKLQAGFDALGITGNQKLTDIWLQWLRDGRFRFTDLPSERRYHLARAGGRLLVLTEGDEDMARNLIGVVMGEAVQPDVKVGAALGGLTIDDARALIKVCDAVTNGAALTFTDDGRPQVAA